MNGDREVVVLLRQSAREAVRPGPPGVVRRFFGRGVEASWRCFASRLFSSNASGFPQDRVGCRFLGGRGAYEGGRKRMRLFDMHCHLGFVNNARELAAALAERGGGALSASV